MYKPPKTETNFDDVGEFHAKFELPVSQGQPGKLTPELIKFRILFMLEELIEFIDGVGANLDYSFDTESFHLIMPDSLGEVDHEKMFDSLLDEVYVAMGTAHLLGYPWQRGWDRVQKANMSKIRAKPDGSDSSRGSSFDVVKPEGWMPPNIAGLLRECGWRVKCPRCGSPDPKRHPAVQFEGEVQVCSDPYHQETNA